MGKLCLYLYIYRPTNAVNKILDHKTQFMMAALQVWASDFHPRGVYELKLSHVQHFTSGIHHPNCCLLNISNPTGHYMYHQFNIQQLYAVPKLYLCVLYVSENKQRGTDWGFK